MAMTRGGVLTDTGSGDVVLLRKEAPASYHLASVWDDALEGVTHVIRGEDLRSATHIHVLIQKLLGVPTPDVELVQDTCSQQPGKP